MTSSPVPPDETERLRVLHELAILDTEVDPVFGAVARLACLHSGCPMGAISLMDADRQWFVASVGLSAREMPRDSSFCAHSICSADGLEVHDAARDPRFSNHPVVVGEPPVVFYAGVPLRVDGQPIGTVFVMDTKRRTADLSCRAALADLATVVGAMLDARLREQRWRLNEARVTAASRAGADWLWETDADGVLTWVSASVVDHIGWLADAEVGRRAMDIHRAPPSDLRASWDRYREARARREPFQDAIAERDTAHGPMLIAMSGRPRHDAAGTFLGYCGAARDVTRDVSERESLLREQRLLHFAIESVNAGLMISGPDGRVRISNSSWRKKVGIFGHGADSNWEDLVREMIRRGQYPQALGREEEFARWRLGLASAKGTAHELRFGGQTVLITDQELPDGNVVHLSIDITKDRRDQLELQQQRERAGVSEARLTAVLKAVPDLWFVLDAQARYVDCSDEDHPLLAQPFAATRGLPVGALSEGGRSMSARTAVARAHATGRVQRFEYELTARDGTRRHFEARISPMPDGQSLYLTRDLTEVRHLEQEVMLLQRALEADGAMPMAIADMQARRRPLIFVNRAFEQLTGFARSELLGRSPRFLLDGDNEPHTANALRRAVQFGTSCTVTAGLRRRDGSRFLCEIQLAPVHDEEGRLRASIGLLKDVTDTTRAAAKLLRSEEIYRAVAEGISDGLLVVSAAGEILTCNTAACAALGSRPEQLLGTRLSRLGFELQHLRDERRVTNAEHPVSRVMRGAGIIDEVYRLRRPDGVLMRVRLRVQSLFDGPGTGQRTCLVTFRDITAQWAAEEALVRAEERWQFALDGAREGVWDYDEDARTVYFSKRWKDTLGLAEHEVGNTLDEWSRRIHPDDKDRVMQAIADYRQGLTPTYETEHRLLHKSGHWVWILDRGKIVERRADGSPRRVVGTHTDITHMKVAEQALLDKQALVLASRAKSEFLSRMSHEMRTPLNAVIGFTQLLQMQPGSFSASQVREYAGHVMQAGQHLLGLVNEVLDLQSVEEGRISLELAPVSVAELVDSTLELMQPIARQSEIVIGSRVPRDVFVRADRQRLQQVLINLVSNAIKYNRWQGRVNISVPHSDSHRVRVAIDDNGRGLTPEQLARLFQPFERLGRESSSIPGSGLGLVIARRLVDEMGGTLTLSSVDGVGTTAQVELLRAEPASPPAATPETPAQPSEPGSARAQRTRVLYVEDNPVNAIVFREAMRLCPQVELQTTAGGGEALALTRHWLPDVLVLDAHLPDMNGFELLQHLRAIPSLRDVPAYMCSADAMPEDLQRAREAGFLDYWTKPIDIGSIVAALASHSRVSSP